MADDPIQLSVPELPDRLPRELTAAEQRGLARVADFLIPARGGLPKASDAPGFADALDIALIARADSFESVVETAAGLGELPAEKLGGRLRRLAAEDPVHFGVLSAVLAGAYLILPEIRQAIGYPGQERRRAQFDEAAEEIMSGILDPVVARGPIYREI
jgi:hypothetical protein